MPVILKGEVGAAAVFLGASGAEELGLLFGEPWASVGRRPLEQVALDLIWKNTFFSGNESSFIDLFASPFMEASCCSLFSLLGRVCLFAAPWTAARQASLSFTISRSLLKLLPIESVMPSNHLILCCPLLLLPSIFPSIRVFSNESLRHMAKVLKLRFSDKLGISFSQRLWGKIFFRSSQSMLA